MPRSIFTAVACAIVVVLGCGSPAPHAQNVTAPTLVRIGGDTQGLQPIRVESAKVDVDVAGRLARTTVLLTLRNPNSRLLEGTLEFPLDANQQVTGFALDVNGELRDAVPVPKDKARETFEAIERRGVDPGLIEETSGNNFRVRVYPIPANGTRQVRLSIDQTLDTKGVALPMALLADVDSVALRVTAQAQPVLGGAFESVKLVPRNGGYEARLQRGVFRATETVRLQLPLSNGPASYVARMEDGTRYVLGEVPFDAGPVRVRAIPKRVQLLWDASASMRKQPKAATYQLLDRYFATMGSGTVLVRFLRDVGEEGGTFEIRNGDWSTLRSALDAAVQDGATNLGDWTPRADVGEFLMVTDGLQDYVDNAFPRIGDAQRLYVIGGGGDATRIAKLAQQRNGRLVDPTQGDLMLRDSPRIVGLAPHGIEDMEVPGRFIDDVRVRVAGRATQAGAYVDVTLALGNERRVVRVDLPVDGPSHPQVANVWGAWKLAALSIDRERNAKQIARIGQKLSLVTPGTSLLVLENVQDYLQYDITPPASLREQFDMLHAVDVKVADDAHHERMDEVAQRWAQRIEWWERKFPKGSPVEVAKKLYREQGVAVAAAAAEQAREEDSQRRSESFQYAAPPPAPSPAPSPAPMAAMEPAPAAAAAAPELDAIRVNESAATITLQPWQPDSPYARRLRAAKATDVYALYLDERDDNANSTAFYLDVADVLMEKGRRAEALRVMSNLAELQLESRHVLRVLGYRLMQAKDYTRAVEVFRKVLVLADEEPQSHRDLGLALAAKGERQEAIEHLYDIVQRDWDGRFDEVELVALNELNAIIATSPKPLSTAIIDRRLLRNLPVDLRAVLAWDSDNSDMDLWVTDPNGEKCYYGNRLTFQGGMLSDDFTGGYGPEEFLLRDAKPGKYRVEANFFGDRQQVVTGATTLTLTLTTGWGTAKRKDQVVTLRLQGKRDTVLVGEFEVK